MAMTDRPYTTVIKTLAQTVEVVSQPREEIIEIRTANGVLKLTRGQAIALGYELLQMSDRI